MITFEEAFNIANNYISAECELQEVAETPSDYLFSCFEFQESRLVDASLVIVDKVSGDIKDDAVMSKEDKNNLRQQWNSSVKIRISKTDYIREVSSQKPNKELIFDYLISEGDSDFTTMNLLYTVMERHEDLLEELCQCVRQDNFDINNPVVVKGHTAKTIYAQAPFMNYMGVYLCMASLREQAEE